MTRLAEMQQRIILLVDDAQVILDGHGQLSREWQQFLAEYLDPTTSPSCISRHAEWPIWTGRERSFVVDGNEAVLPPLDQVAGRAIWQRLGFTDVVTIS